MNIQDKQKRTESISNALDACQTITLGDIYTIAKINFTTVPTVINVLFSRQKYLSKLVESNGYTLVSKIDII